MSAHSIRGVIVHPHSADEVPKYARRALRVADAVGQLPTPIDDLLAAATIGNLKIDEEVKQNFAARLMDAARQEFNSTWQKIRGIADLRERVTYVDENTTPTRIRFAKGHELGHQVLPWHRLDPYLFDDDKSLTGEAEEIFDVEANLFSAEVLFQGNNFTRLVRDYAVGFNSIFNLAAMHEASRHATAWRYVEEQDESVALVTYWPSKFNTEMLRRGKVVESRNFLRKFSDIDLPLQLGPDHDWTTTHTSDPMHGDTISLTCGKAAFRFEWEAWWNRYVLLVLLRHKPKLHIVRYLADRVTVASGRQVRSSRSSTPEAVALAS